jgi:hypothetical protein
MMSDITRGFDVDSYNKPNFNFDAAFNEGYGTAIVKLGGNNLSGNQPYRMNGYPDFANKQAKFPIRGAYWVTGGGNPYAAAVFYAQNRAPWTNLDILDNERLDSGNPWNDAQACIFFDTLASFRLPGYNPWQYGSRDSLWKSWGPWPGLQARKVLALIALYNGAPLQNIGTNYDGALTKGHQWSSSATIGGSGNIDANAFTPDAFITKPKGRSGMSTLFYSSVPSPVPDDYAAQGFQTGYIWSLAGDGEGEGAWLETQDTHLADQLAGFHSISQNSVYLSWPSWIQWRDKYRKGAPTAQVQVDDAAIAKAFGDAIGPAIENATQNLNFQFASQGTLQKG